jgi:hypothetical protein
MTEAALSVPPATPGGGAIVAAYRPSAWSVLAACAGRGPASPAAPRPGTPNPGRGPAGCLLDGLPPGRRPRQGRCAVLRTGLRPPLTRPSSRRPGETRSPGAGEDLSPTSRQEARTVADQAGTPTPAGTC